MLSILAAASITVGHAGTTASLVTAGAQCSLPARLESAASIPTESNRNPAAANFQQAFTSALRDSIAEPPTALKVLSSASSNLAADTHSGIEDQLRPAPRPVASQLPATAKQLLVIVDPLMSGVLSSLPVPKGQVESRAWGLPSLLKGDSGSKSAVATQGEPTKLPSSQATAGQP